MERPLTPYPWREPGWASLWAGLPNVPAFQLAAATERACRAGSPLLHAAWRVRWRLVHDPVYRRLAQSISTPDWERLETAGLFDDGLGPGSLHELRRSRSSRVPSWCLPWGEPREVRSGGAVLVFPGGFAPFHSGHTAALQAARRCMEERGLAVAYAVVAPCHDGYVFQKDRGDQWPAERRLESIHQGLAEAEMTGWAVTDGLECLVSPGPMNFTDVMAAWRHRLGPSVPLWLVCGADNAGFALTAGNWESDDGYGVVVVGRPGWEGGVSSREAPPSGSRVLWAPGSNPSRSTDLRRQTVPDEAPSDTPTLFVRNEGLWAVAHWEDRVPRSELDAAWARWHAGLIGVLAKYVAPWKVTVLDLEHQRNWARRTARGRRLLSLDPALDGLPGVTAYPQSRGFAVAGAQRTPIAHVVRPGCSLPSVAPGPLWLVDDDIASGGTMRHAEESLPPDTRVRGRLSLWAALCRRAQQPAVGDVVDARDFLPGARDAGLVVSLPGNGWGRVPYMAPYTNLVTRASVPPARVRRLSADLWRLAGAFFDSLPEVLRVKDTPVPAQAAWDAWQVDPELALSTVCRLHAELLETPTEWRSAPELGCGEEAATV